MAVVMAMKHSRLLVLLGSLAALGCMTVLSVLMGRILPALIDDRISSVAATVLFAVFGVQMVYDWWSTKNNPSESDGLASTEIEMNAQKQEGRAGIFRYLSSSVLLRTFSLTFLAEWGDRSQLTTVMLAASRNTYGVTAGGLLGQTLCTCLAVLGGKLLAQRISEHLVNLIGGISFLLFATVIGSSTALKLLR